MFVPTIPSMRIADLAAAIAPGCAIDVVGIRPGEKLHEVLLSEDEARHARDLDDTYVIMPEGEEQQVPVDRLPGRSLAEGFRYSSDSNDQWFDARDLERILQEQPSVR